MNSIPPSPREGSVWPPPIEHDTSIPQKPLDKSIIKTIRKRWYYSIMAMFFGWLSVHEYLKHSSLILTSTSVIDWSGMIYFAWQMVSAWLLHFRSSKK